MGDPHELVDGRRGEIENNNTATAQMPRQFEAQAPMQQRKALEKIDGSNNATRGSNTGITPAFPRDDISDDTDEDDDEDGKQNGASWRELQPDVLNFSLPMSATTMAK